MVLQRLMENGSPVAVLTKKMNVSPGGRVMPHVALEVGVMNVALSPTSGRTSLMSLMQSTTSTAHTHTHTHTLSTLSRSFPGLGNITSAPCQLTIKRLEKRAGPRRKLKGRCLSGCKVKGRCREGRKRQRRARREGLADYRCDENQIKVGAVHILERREKAGAAERLRQEGSARQQSSNSHDD